MQTIKPVAAKPVLAVDLDDTLAGFVKSLVTFHNEAYGSELKIEDFKSYDFWEVWGGTEEEATAKMSKFFESDHFKVALKPLPAAKRTLKQLQKQFDLQVVTSRQHFLEEASTNWLNEHFPSFFSSIRFGNHYGTEGEKRSKADLCKEIGAIGLIDDSFRYAKQVAEEGIPCVLFGKYAWNGGLDDPETPQELPAKVRRVTGWKGVLRALRSLNVRGTPLAKTVKVMASRNAQFHASIVRKRLDNQDFVDIIGTKNAMMNAADTAQLLERVYCLKISKIKTNYVTLQNASQHRIEIRVEKTPAYIEFMEKVNAAAVETAETA